MKKRDPKKQTQINRVIRHSGDPLNIIQDKGIGEIRRRPTSSIGLTVTPINVNKPDRVGRSDPLIHFSKHSSGERDILDSELQIQRKRLRSEESQTPDLEWLQRKESDLSQQNENLERGIEHYKTSSRNSKFINHQIHLKGRTQIESSMGMIQDRENATVIKKSSLDMSYGNRLIRELSSTQPLLNKTQKISQINFENNTNNNYETGLKMTQNDQFYKKKFDGQIQSQRFRCDDSNTQKNKSYLRNSNSKLQNKDFENKFYFRDQNNPNLLTNREILQKKSGKYLKNTKYTERFQQNQLDFQKRNSLGRNNSHNRNLVKDQIFSNNFPQSSRQIRNSQVPLPQISSSRDLKKNFNHQESHTPFSHLIHKNSGILIKNNLFQDKNRLKINIPQKETNEKFYRPRLSHREIGTTKYKISKNQVLENGYDFKNHSQRNISGPKVQLPKNNLKTQRPSSQSLRFVKTQTPVINQNNNNLQRHSINQRHIGSSERLNQNDIGRKTYSNRQIYSSVIPGTIDSTQHLQTSRKLISQNQMTPKAWNSHSKAQLIKPMNQINVAPLPFNSGQHLERFQDSSLLQTNQKTRKPRFQSAREILLRSQERRRLAHPQILENPDLKRIKHSKPVSIQRSHNMNRPKPIYSMRQLNIDLERNAAIQELKKLENKERFINSIKEPQIEQNLINVDQSSVKRKSMRNMKTSNLMLRNCQDQNVISKEKDLILNDPTGFENKLLNRASFIQTKEIANQGNLSNHSDQESRNLQIFESQRHLEPANSHLSGEPLIENQQTPFAAAFGDNPNEPPALANSDQEDNQNDFQEIFAKNLDNSERGIFQLDGPRLFPDAEIGAKSFTNMSRNQENGSMMFINDGSQKLLSKPGQPFFHNNLGIFSGKYINKGVNATGFDSRRSFIGGIGSEKRMFDVLPGSGIEVTVSKHSISGLGGKLNSQFDQQIHTKSQKSNLSGNGFGDEKFGNFNGMNFEKSKSNRILHPTPNPQSNKAINNLFVPKILNKNNSVSQYGPTGLGSFKFVNRTGSIISTSTRQIGATNEINSGNKIDNPIPFFSAQKNNQMSSIPQNRKLEPFLENIREHSEKMPESNRYTSNKDISSQSLLERDSLFKGFVAKRNVFIGEGAPNIITQANETNFDSTRVLPNYPQGQINLSNRQIQNHQGIQTQRGFNNHGNSLSFRNIGNNRLHQMKIHGSNNNIELANRPSLVSLKNHISSHKLVKLPCEQKKALQEPWDLSERNLNPEHLQRTRNTIQSLKHIEGNSKHNSLLVTPEVFHVQNDNQGSNLLKKHFRNINSQNLAFGVGGHSSFTIARGRKSAFNPPKKNYKKEKITEKNSQTVSLSPEREDQLTKNKKFTSPHSKIQSSNPQFQKPNNVFIYSGQKIESSNSFKTSRQIDITQKKNWGKRDYDEAIGETLGEPLIGRRISKRLMKKRKKLMFQKEEEITSQEEYKKNKNKKTKGNYKKKKADWIKKLSESLPELTLDNAYPCIPSEIEAQKITEQNKLDIRKDLEFSLTKADQGPRKEHSNLLKVIITLFVLGEVHPDITTLTEDQRGILEAIFYRKFKKRVDTNLKGELLGAELHRIVSQSCMKKNEERWKFTYKKTLKHLKALFYQRANSFKSVPNERDFLKFYFQQASLEKDLPLDYFHDPLIQKYRKRKSRVKDPRSPKSINTWYLSLIFGSPRFVRDFFQYVEGDFRREALKEIPDKFFLIFDTYLGKKNKKKKLDFQKQSQNQNQKIEIEKSTSKKKKVYTNGKEYFEQNKRCKLPWTYFDVDQAVQAVKLVWKDLHSSRALSIKHA